MNAQVGPRQIEALQAYGVQFPGVTDYLKKITQPTLVVQGHNDVIAPTINSYTLQQTLPNAQLILYPDANHGSFYQYPELFVSQAEQFLSWQVDADTTVAEEERLPFPALPA